MHRRYCTGTAVTFEPGGRNNWHPHSAGQPLVVTAGRGYYQVKGQPVWLLRKGKVVQSQSGVRH